VIGASRALFPRRTRGPRLHSDESTTHDVLKQQRSSPTPARQNDEPVVIEQKAAKDAAA